MRVLIKLLMQPQVRPGWLFTFCHAPSNGQSVNEVEDPGGMAGKWRRGCQCVKVVWVCGGTSLCVAIGIVDFRWASSGQSKFLGEWASLRCCCWPLPASGPLSILNAHFRPHTCSRHDWMIIFYFMDVFHVVYKVICAAPPISLVMHLKM